MAVLNVELRPWLRLARAGLVKPVTDKRGTKRLHFYDLRETAKLIDRLARAAPVVKTVREGLVRSSKITLEPIKFVSWFSTARCGLSNGWRAKRAAFSVY